MNDNQAGHQLPLHVSLYLWTLLLNYSSPEFFQILYYFGLISSSSHQSVDTILPNE